MSPGEQNIIVTVRCFVLDFFTARFYTQIKIFLLHVEKATKFPKKKSEQKESSKVSSLIHFPEEHEFVAKVANRDILEGYSGCGLKAALKQGHPCPPQSFCSERGGPSSFLPLRSVPPALGTPGPGALSANSSPRQWPGASGFWGATC